jgi:hypothetical protein
MNVSQVRSRILHPLPTAPLLAKARVRGALRARLSMQPRSDPGPEGTPLGSGCR